MVGFPNAGKSTFLSVVSNAKPEIADYAFTTLTPNLGVATIDETDLLVADIPGLIEGASEGKGLGDAFLRHVERTSVLFHLIDAYSNDVAADYQTIRNELQQYSPELTTRPEVIGLTKIDGLDDDIIAMQRESLQAVAGDVPVYALSSTAHKGLKEVLRALGDRVAEVKQAAIEAGEEESDDPDMPVITLGSQRASEKWTVELQDDGVFVVTGEKIEKFARRTNFDGYENVNRLRDIMKKMGISHELIRKGATGESMVRIGGAEFTLLEQ